ncbi:interleukin-17D-like [Patiria miniata]|uniref:Uncharacterized protein n=1 Tax=Patiria miniata TaxID=46514 RepID=A0A913ZZW1_PATMI|nr:interleukin-17D-like [Patiria miniata]
MANPIGGDPPAACPSAPLTLFGPDSLPPDRETHQESNETCPVGDLVQDHWPKSRSATCPWQYVNDYNPNRFPASISQAVCSCARQGCLDPYTSEPRPDLQCSPVSYTVPVLRRGDCVDGVSDIYQDFESVSVACACMRPVMPPVMPIDERPPGIIG